MSSFDKGIFREFESLATILMDGGLKSNYNFITPQIAQMHTGLTEMHGFVPFVPTRYTLPSVGEEFENGEAIRFVDFSLGKIRYAMKPTGLGFKLTKYEKRELDKLLNDMDALENRLAWLRDSTNVGIDLRTFQAMLNTTFNAQANVAAQWDDKINSKPYEDMQNFVDNVAQGSNQVVMGRRALNLLRNHPDTKSMSHHYESDALAPVSAMEQIIKDQVSGIEKVIFVDGLYNAARPNADKAASLAITRFFEKNTWIGSSDALHHFSQTEGETEQDYDFDHKEVKVSYDTTSGITRLKDEIEDGAPEPILEIGGFLATALDTPGVVA